MNRQNWKFYFKSVDLLNACEKKITHHQDRLDWWTKEKNTVEPELKDSIQVKTFPVSGGDRAELSADVSIKNRYDEANSKIRFHREKVEEYERWQRAFHLADNQSFELSIEDVTYFGL